MTNSVKQLGQYLSLLFCYVFFHCLVRCISKKEGEKSASNSETYKATVQKNNPKPVKEVGKVDTEFLNSDNLYENYSHNYSITFPTNFKVNYGIGQYSEVQAYDKDLAYTIIVNVAKSDVSKFFNSSQTIDEISEIMVKGVLEEFRSRKGVDKMERSLTEKGLSDVVLLSANLTNFHNRYFIDSRYSANVIIDNEKFPVIMTDYVTFYNNNVYHFFFRSWKDLHNAAWKNQIKTTMATVLINKAITNNYTNP